MKIYIKALKKEFRITEKTKVGNIILYPDNIVSKSYKLGSIVKIKGEDYKLLSVKPYKASYGLDWVYYAAKKEGNKYTGKYRITGSMISG